MNENKTIKHPQIKLLDLVNINPSHLIFINVFVTCLLGVPFAFLIDTHGAYFNMTGLIQDNSYIFKSYYLSIYAFLIMIALYYACGIKKKLSYYAKKELVPVPNINAKLLWGISFAAALLCLIYVTFQVGFVHPAISALSLDSLALSALRIQTTNTINNQVLNAGLLIFLPFNIILSLFIIRKKFLMITSFLLLIVMGSFTLAKAPIGNVVLIVLIFYILLKLVRLKNILKYVFLAGVLVSAMYFLTGFANNLPSLVRNIGNRIIYGQITDLPYYFQQFEYQKVSFTSMLPPYLASQVGGIQPSAARIVMKYSNPYAVSTGTAGVSNTLFIGEAYAFAGYGGVIISPIIIMAYLAFVVHLFSRLKKNIYFLFIYTLIIYLIFRAITGGFSYFIISSLSLLILISVYFVLLYLFTKASKNYHNSVKIDS